MSSGQSLRSCDHSPLQVGCDAAQGVPENIGGPRTWVREDLETQMQEAANNLEFELAADIRDRIREVREEFDLEGDEEGIAPPGEEF